LVVLDEVSGEALLGGGVAAGVGPEVLGVLVGPVGPDRLADAVDAAGLAELVGAVGVPAHEDVLGEVDVDALDGVQAEGDVAVDPHLADGHGHALALDRLDDPLNRRDGLLARDPRHRSRLPARGG
jgi:hypothetical protein